MKSKEAQEIKAGMTLADGFVVESVYMAIGSAPRSYFATGLRYGCVPSKQYLGKFGHKLNVKG
jgi:hypothetical protein